MSEFDYDDQVIVADDAPQDCRPGCKAWVVGVFENHDGAYFKGFPGGVVYTIEFEDGTSIEIHESKLRRLD
ncbi:hypothetical protein [Chitinivorax sp. B]|uniref:hypothetical protein n=1 Tax=Chitinivorax sp. B TaxID=2502235 RepID=UPI0010F7BB86|nr:hypothetical protein [Chitinivorax sp. B]